MVSYISIEVPEMYPYVLAVTAALCVECVFIGFGASKNRSKIFSKEFMEQWNDQHQAELKADAPRGGYPDMGNGIYGMKLTYKDWF